MTPGERLLDVYRRLLDAYGPQGWWPGDSPFEVMAGAVLTQSAAWANVEKALANLKSAGALSLEGIEALSEAELARLLYPAGYHNAKARKLKALAGLVRSRFGGDLGRMLATPAAELRPLLLATHGIGPETADAILLYAAGRASFVVDAYTRRIFSRLGVEPDAGTYEAWRALFESNLAPDAPLFNEYHALIVRHGKDVCRREPLCAGCVLLDLCETGRARTLGASGSGLTRAPAAMIET
ncbi:MAG: endonuclease III domain-containing protein [Dehalococcoidia bacterium]